MGSDVPHQTDRETHSERTEPSIDVSLDLLADQHRRDVLYRLRETDGAVEVSELAAHIADREGIDSQQVHSELFHNHLPRLEDAGIVAYDANRGVLTDFRETEFLGDCLDLAAEHEPHLPR